MAKINTIFSMTDEVTNPLKRMQSQLEKTSRGFNDMAIKMLGVNQAVQLISTSINAFKKASAVMDEWVASYNEQFVNETKLATVMKTRMNATDETVNSIKEFMSAQQELGIYSAGMMTAGAQELSTYISDTETLKTLIPMINDMVAQGVGFKATERDVTQYATMVGKVMGGAMGGMSDRGYTFTEEEKQAFKLMNELERAQFLVNAVKNSIGEQNKELAKTPIGQIKQLENSYNDFFQSLGENLSSVSNAFKSIRMTVVLYFREPIEKSINWIKQNLSTLTATIIYLGTITTAVGTIMATAWAIANWPITLAITLIATLIRMMIDLTASANASAEAMNGFGNQCAQAGNTFGMVVGFIAGTVGGLMNIIYNVIAVVYNALMYISEFILNVFTHPINAIARLFIDLSNTIVQVLSTMAGAVDWVFNTSMSATLNEASRQIEAFKEKNFGKVDFKYQKLSLKDVKGIMSATIGGGNIGKDLGNILDQKFAMGKFQAPQLPNAQQPFKTDGNGALLVSDVNMIDIADDYRELLSKRATEKFNLQFSQVTPQVEIAGITVNNNTDLDRVFETLVNGVEEASSTSLAG